jgi:hypothetical protein
MAASSIFGVIALGIILFSTIGTICFLSGITINTYKAAQGDSAAIGDIIDDTTTEVVDEVQWIAYSSVAIAFLEILAILGIPVAIIIAALKSS